MDWLRQLPRVALWVGVLLGSALILPLSPATGANYTVPLTSKLTATLPAGAFGSDTHLLCLVRFDVQGSQLQSRSLCYESYKPNPPPVLPISDFWPAYHQLESGTFIEGSGWLVLPVINCTEFFPGMLAVSVLLSIELDKGGGVASGSAVVVTDTTDPFDCDVNDPDTSVATGALTLEPLELNDDTDGDGCYDYDELGTNERAGGLRDPFNEWDYFNPTNDGANRSDDIDLVVSHYRDDQWPPAGGYDVKYDRTGLEGGNDWNLGPPNGTIRAADINAIVMQYRHDCGDGSVSPPKPTPWPTPQ